MPDTLPTAVLAQQAATLLAERWDAYHREFTAITRRARTRFEQRDWHAAQGDSVERLELYPAAVAVTRSDVAALLGSAVDEAVVREAIKPAFTLLMAGRDDYILAETFYNSVTMRLFATAGLDPLFAYIGNEIAPPPLDEQHSVYTSYGRPTSTVALLTTILGDYRFDVPFVNTEHDALLAAAAIERELAAPAGGAIIDGVDMARQVFYRNKGAYLIGRIRQGGRLLPLICSLLNTAEGVVVDTVLLSEEEASIVFSFTRSYFLVDADRPHELVAFLLSIMPLKRRSELYASIGHNRHGKTELYRRLQWLLTTTDEQFETARGEPGLVMTVFTMPSLAVVFKIIKDRFGFPKNTTRQHVLNRYQLVMRHDRAGRLADAQEFEHMRIARSRFDPVLLAELLKVAAKTVSVEGEWVLIRHCYTERRMTPLNLYVREAAPEAALAAVIDFGQAIKDLAASNIFPGDVLLKNFGVTRHGRVIFYDYDELCLLTDCNFREMPAARSYEEELSAEPWFRVAENDIFPEEFRTFLGLPAELKATFEAHHGDLFRPAFWQAMQQRHRDGEIIDIFPYAEHRRLRGAGDQGRA